MKKTSKLLTVVLSLLIALLLLSSAVAVPVLWRGFYYGQIDTLGLVEETGFPRQVIQGAYDEVMDYLVLNKEFGTGKLRWSPQGMAHFADCRVLFRADFIIAGASALLLFLVLLLWVGMGRRRPHRFLGQGPCFWAFMGMTLIGLALVIWAAVDFTSLFTAFHMVFFPGKTNWMFDYRTDQIILILPEAFWANAGTLIAALVFGTGLLLAAAEIIIRRINAPRSVYEQLRKLPRKS